MANKDDKIWKKWWFWVIILLIFILCSRNQNTSDDINNDDILNTSNEAILQEEKYYEADETINKYITLFNNMYPNSQITSDMLSIYYHHGSHHENQVTLTLQDLPIIITANYKNSISINIDNTNDNNIVIKSLVKKFVKVFDSSIADEKIDQYIDTQGVGSNIDTYDNIEYWTNKDGKGDRIIYIKITGKLK